MISSQIIESCLNKEEKGFQALYEQSINYAFSIVKRYIQRKDKWQDIVQEVYITVFKKLHTFNPRKGEFKSWLRKIVVNTCLMEIRSANKMSVLLPIHLTPEPSYEPSNEFFELSKEELELMLKDMPKGYRTVFMLVVIDEYDHKEVAEILGITKETSRSQLARAKKWMIRKFADYKKNNLYGIL